MLLAVWALGSGIGGLTYGGREHASAPGPRWVRLAALFPLCSIPLAAGPLDRRDGAPGRDRRLCLAPYMAAANQLVGDVAPAGAVTEAFAWPITAIGLGAPAATRPPAPSSRRGAGARGSCAVVAAGAVTALIAVAGRATVRA